MSENDHEAQRAKAVEIAERHLKAMNKKHAEALVKGVVRHALACGARGAVIKRDDVMKRVLHVGQHSKTYAAVFERAQAVLRSLFGMEMTRLPNKATSRAKKNQPKDAPVQRFDFILRSIVPKKETEPFINANIALNRDGVGVPKRTLLCIVLAVILAEKRKITADALYKHLEIIGIFRQSSHTIFEKVEDVIAEFIKDEYLEKLKNDELSNPTSSQKTTSLAAGVDEIIWGPRAKVEFPEAEVMQFIAKMFPESDAANIEAILSQVA